MDEEDQEFFDAEEDLFVDCEDNVNLQSETEDSEPSSNVHETSLETQDTESDKGRKRKRKPKGSRQKLLGRPKRQKRSRKSELDADESEDTEARDESIDQGGGQGAENNDTTTANQDSSAPPIQVKRKYTKRKGRSLTGPKKKPKLKKLDTSVLHETGSDNASDSSFRDGKESGIEATSNAHVDETGEGDKDSTAVKPKERKKYGRRKNKLSMPKKGARRNFQRGSEEDGGYESVECAADGDDHAEYEYRWIVPPNPENSPYSPPMDLLMTDFHSESGGIESLAYDLSQHLSDTSWIVDTVENTCRMSLLGPTVNVTVEKSITWSSGKAQMFVNNKPLPKTSFIWGAELENTNSIPDITNYLLRLATVLGSFHVCNGILSYDNLWDSAQNIGRGSIESDFYQGSRCFRSANCMLAIIEQGLCHECKKQKEVFRKSEWKRLHRAGKDKSKVNNQVLQRKELLEKVKAQQKEKKNVKRQNNKLRKRIRKLIEKDAISVDHHLSQDLTKILKDNVHKMSPIQKMFWGEQLKALSRQDNPRSMRWSPMMIKIALHLQMVSPAASRYLKESGILALPSERTLFDFTHFVEAKEGVQDAIINLLKEKLDNEKLEYDEEFYNLLFDELTVRADIVLNGKGEIIGCVNMTGIESSILNLETELADKAEPTMKKSPAKKVLVYMLQGISRDVQEIVGIFATSELSAEQLYTRTWDVVYSLESRGLKILSLICDGASCNKKFFKMHTSWDPNSNCVYSTKNIASGEDRPIFFIVDPPHLLKTIRNCFSNSNAHKHSRAMWKDGEEISWEAIEKLHDVSISDKFKEHKLTRAHVKLTAFSMMNVCLATQVMSGSVASSLKKFINDLRFNGLITHALIAFLFIVNTFFDCLNGSNDPDGKRNKKNRNLHPYTSVDDNRLKETLPKVLEFFDDWYDDVQNREGNYTKEERERMMISMQSYESLHITINGFIGAVRFLLENGAKSVDAKKFNQDKLEQYFGLLRMSGGGSNNPNVKTVLQKCLSLTVQKGAALPAAKGNTGGERRTLTVNQEALPRRGQM